MCDIEKNEHLVNIKIVNTVRDSLINVKYMYLNKKKYILDVSRS